MITYFVRLIKSVFPSTEWSGYIYWSSFRKALIMQHNSEGMILSDSLNQY